jgi:N-acetylneuraminate synthase
MEFVAEFTTNHLGNLNLLLRMTEKAASAGATFIKMQKKDVPSFYPQERLDSAYESPYGKTYYEYRSLLEFGDDDFSRFDQRCRELGIRWFCTAQDSASLDFVLKFDLPAYKVASINARNLGLLREVAARVPRDKRIIISVGGSSLSEVESALSVFDRHSVYLLHCVAEYPCPLDSLRLGNIAVLREKFGSDRVRIGYSGHEVGVAPSLAAIALGADLVERHFALTRSSFAHHIECSLEPDEFKELCDRGCEGSASLGRYVDLLPKEALRTSFGMSDAERGFLLEHRYGSPEPTA